MSQLSIAGEILLDDFGYHLNAIFGGFNVYHVGSSLRAKVVGDHAASFNDVDVRIILDDERYANEGYGDPERPQDNQKWVSMTLMLSAFGRAMTGLPIDCQIQQQTYANTHFSRKTGDPTIPHLHARSALGLHRQIREQNGRKEPTP